MLKSCSRILRTHHTLFIFEVNDENTEKVYNCITRIIHIIIYFVKMQKQSKSSYFSSFF